MERKALSLSSFYFAIGQLAFSALQQLRFSLATGNYGELFDFVARSIQEKRVVMRECRHIFFRRAGLPGALDGRPLFSQ